MCTAEVSLEPDIPDMAVTLEDANWQTFPRLDIAGNEGGQYIRTGTQRALLIYSSLSLDLIIQHK